MSKNIVEMHQITKAFPGVLALDSVDFNCMQGEVHALVGENGAGKSTLMKILAGAYRPDSGRIILRGNDIAFHSPREAQRHGISIIYQEFNLIPDLSVAENIFLGREPQKRMGFIDNTSLSEKAQSLLEDLGVAIDLGMRVSELGVAQQQMIEIAKALSLNADIIMMDEPSAVVSGKELESLFRIIRTLKANKKAIIYISHRIDEIFQIADRATVLKDGKLVGTVQTSDVDKPKVVSMMVGRSLSETFPQRKKLKQKQEVLALKNVSREGFLKDISFNVHKGEILGIAGLVGAGRSELARAIFGADPIDMGEIILKEKIIKKSSPKNSIVSGIGFVTENRAHDGLIHSLSLRKNLTLAILERVKKWFYIRDRYEKEISKQSVDQFKIITPSIEQEVRYLSGGNQQKVILAKWININLSLLILDEPTRGIDVGTKSEVYTLMRRLADQGTAIIMISSELPEIIGMSDRILVMHDGEIMGVVSPDKATEEGILMMATGQKRTINKAEG
ncbi:MAG: sugar ABC transporter ATP-binding protein [Spirochaetota bacterium]|nr:MAG: sugar ABC transporter ATP-binding protein [Spirochaetota bacterium]